MHQGPAEGGAKLQNANRLRIKQVVMLSPGVHLRKVQRILGTSFSTTRYHVENLERDGEIVSSIDGRYQRLFPAGTTDDMKAAYAAVQSRTARRVLKAIADSPKGTTNGELFFSTIRLPRSTISEQIVVLERAGLVGRHVTLDGRTLYELKDRDRVALVIGTLDRGLLSLATDGFIDLFDF
jgi:predicted transcriptional regulator